MQAFFSGKNDFTGKIPFFLTFSLIILAAVLIKNTAYEEADVGMEAAAVSCYEKVVALTFDDGPGYKTTMSLLNGLKERDVRATFFLLGEKIEERSEVIERMHEDGHLIGNHTYSHIQLDAVNIACAKSEIDRTNEIIREITGEKPGYIRPPYGCWNDELERQIDMQAVLWTVDTCDWNTRNARKIVDYVVNEVESGDIILMHDIYDTSVAAALEIVDVLKNRGYVFVTVDELLIE